MINMIDGLREAINEELEMQEIKHLEDLTEWWLNSEYPIDVYESKEEWESRKRMVIPMLIDNKLKKYEEEYP